MTIDTREMAHIIVPFLLALFTVGIASAPWWLEALRQRHYRKRDRLLLNHLKAQGIEVFDIGGLHEQVRRGDRS
jgi:hypothetical protein